MRKFGMVLSVLLNVFIGVCLFVGAARIVHDGEQTRKKLHEKETLLAYKAGMEKAIKEKEE